eukprot:3498370-Alexandrium_andersonii.AAC.1
MAATEGRGSGASNDLALPSLTARARRGAILRSPHALRHRTPSLARKQGLHGNAGCDDWQGGNDGLRGTADLGAARSHP